MKTDSHETKQQVNQILGCLIVVMLAVLGGCSSFEFDANRSQDKLEKSNKQSLLDKLVAGSKDDLPIDSARKKIRWDGQGVVLGDVDSSVFTTESFRETTSLLVQENRFTSITNLINKYPDIALAVLQEADPVNQDAEILQMIARHFDQQWCASGSDAKLHWQTYLVDLASSGRKKGSLLELKSEFWRHLKNNEPVKALSLKLVNSLPKQTDIVLSSEFYRLEAIALMMNGQMSEAIQRLRHSIDLIDEVSPYQSNRQQLLLGEFYRHSGELDRWKASWSEAVIQQSALVQTKALHDPKFWNRASFLRPAGQPWPAKSIENLQQNVTGQGIVLPPQLTNDSIVWLATGLQHNFRSEGQSAVLAFKKSEAASNDAELNKQLQLFQARAMVLSGQPGVASAILIRIISENPGEVIGDRAQAILGAMKLQNGAIGQGINLLKAAMGTVDQWPQSERLRAQADYGLALLVSGNETEGLSVLSDVQREFEAIGEFDQAHQCLWNKAKYFEKTDQKQRYQTACLELTDIEKRIQ